MTTKTIITALLVIVPLLSSAQNQTDASGKKQGPWIKKFPNGQKQYEGNFKDDKPVGLFKRYYDDGTLMAELNYSPTEERVYAVFYHPDGKKAGEGLYLKKKKEGIWKFYSAVTEGYLIGEENYLGDLRDGIAQRYYPDGAIAEKLIFSLGIKTGPWVQFYPDGKLCLKAEYKTGKLEGPFTFWFPNGQIQYEGQYISNIREGKWKIFNEDGAVRQIVEYREGRPADPALAEKETKLLDELEKNKGKIEIEDINGDIIR